MKYWSKTSHLYFPPAIPTCSVLSISTVAKLSIELCIPLMISHWLLYMGLLSKILHHRSLFSIWYLIFPWRFLPSKRVYRFFFVGLSIDVYLSLFILFARALYSFIHSANLFFHFPFFHFSIPSLIPPIYSFIFPFLHFSILSFIPSIYCFVRIMCLLISSCPFLLVIF